MPGGAPIDLFTLENAHGITVRVMTYGATMVSVRTPDRNGHLDDIILGFDALEPYVDSTAYFGSLVGRVANRIANSRFVLDGTTYQLARNNGPHHLHGGMRGWSHAVWRADPIPSDKAHVSLHHRSPDGDEGYPGCVDVEASFTLDDANALRIDYIATTDRATPINLTHHPYFNLAGPASDSVLNHELQLLTDRYVPIGAGILPVGPPRSVAGTPLDFREVMPVGARIDDPHPQVALAAGYDHSFAIARDAGDTGTLARAARLRDPITGRVLEISTTEPAIHVYSANFLDGATTGRQRHTRRAAVCLETQHFPDAPNRPEFPSTILRPGQIYRASTVFTFA